jgi:hypothetical protein
VCALLGATLFFSTATLGHVQTAPHAEDQVTAQWISHPTAPPREPGVFHFRKFIQLSKQPARLVEHVSADNRFQLFVNGKRVGEGPARGDLPH